MNVYIIIGFLLFLLVIIATDKFRAKFTGEKTKLGPTFYIIYAILMLLSNLIYSTFLDPYRSNPDPFDQPTSRAETFIPLTQSSVTYPQKKDLTYISFTGHNFSRGKRFKVYSAPSTTSWFTKASNGDPVHASTNDIIYVAGYAGNWLLIRYETKGGSYRMGYTSEASGSFNTLSFNYYTGTITSNCSLTDGTSSIDISSDTTVTVLGRMDAGIYIEAHVNGQQARGIVPESCVSW